MENSFQNLIRYIEKQTAFKCQQYKEKPLKRRVMVRMRALGFEDFFHYHNYLKNNPAEFEKLLDTLTINLSYFFRNPETFDYLKKNIFPTFKKKNNTVTIWSAGCARGEEPYSLAITAAESTLLNKVRIYGTDIDENALARAEKGVYSSVAFQYTPEHIKAHYFEQSAQGYLISNTLRRRVEFSNLDVFEIASFAPCDLIVCRNVLIYLDRNAQSIIVRNFHNQLKTGGYMVIGKVELLIGLPEAKLFEVVSHSEHVYRKKTDNVTLLVE